MLTAESCRPQKQGVARVANGTIVRRNNNELGPRPESK